MKHLVSILMIAAILYGGYSFYNNNDSFKNFILQKMESFLEKEKGVEKNEIEKPSEVDVIVQEETVTAPMFPNTYINDTYSFEISYPNNCEALADADNLYGWPNGIVLIYCGGQAYDIAIEAWNTQAEYQTRYPNGVEIVEEINNMFVTVADITMEPLNTDIISTFTLME